MFQCRLFSGVDGPSTASPGHSRPLFELLHTRCRTRIAVAARSNEIAILCATLGYEHPTVGLTEEVVGWFLARISLLRDMGEGMVLWCPSKWRGRLLDVGCGSGTLLKNFAQLGWEVHGIEADPTAATLARNGLGLDVQTGKLNQVALQMNTST
jgi:2-polyprenyl-3-methyl-5-hydroxy-6-metoxy-1,4-benzoquinol methylase